MFFYLKPTSWTPKTDTIFAIKTSGELHPCTYQSDYHERDKKTYESFIRGTGWKKSKKGYEVPVYRGTTQDEFQAYLNEYGKYCLFFSITGFQLGSGDCVVWAAQQEFNVILSVGYDYVAPFLERLNAINQKIAKRVQEEHGVDVFSNKVQFTKQEQCVGSYDLFYIKPHYSVMAYCLTKPHIDPVTDDEKLWKHYVAVNGHKYVQDNEGKFPVSVKDRLTFLFGKEVAKEYEELMNDFPMA